MGSRRSAASPVSVTDARAEFSGRRGHLVGEQTGLTRSSGPGAIGFYNFVNLPIGTYTLTYTADGFESQKTPHITVQADRTATVNVPLKVGQTTPR